MALRIFVLLVAPFSGFFGFYYLELWVSVFLVEDFVGGVFDSSW